MSEVVRPLIEAALFISGRSLSVEDIAKICNSGNIGDVRKTLEDLRGEYLGRNSGLEISESGGMYAMRVRRDLEEGIMHLAPETDMPPAVLKTLALIAYEQPITQSSVVKQRGNGAYRYIKRLKEQELIETHKSGRTKIITVTGKFRDYFQIQDLKNIVKDEKPDVKQSIV
ncbi:MAG: SMC-Scp complex subunit ScpB [Candidatus Altiarchaeota archaeon]|nr:SMC-Scp complex subunit ScpB [Candidatus Altiarchaeota archaeon]